MDKIILKNKKIGIKSNMSVIKIANILDMANLINRFSNNIH